MHLSFDRGTLLLHCPRGALDTYGLPDVRWDRRVERYRAPAFRYSSIVAAFAERGLSWREDRRVDGEGAAVRPWRAIDLRPYQQAALMSWMGANMQGLVVMPTGSGKTRLACAAMSTCGVPTLCLAPTRVLLHQWRAEIEQHYSGQVGCLGDGQRQIAAVTVATFEGAYRRMDRLGGRFGLLVVDEVHHFGAGQRDEALAMCMAPRRLGLTATAPKDAALEELTDLLGAPVCELAISDLAGRWLASFDTVVLRLRLTAAERRRYDEASAIFREVYQRFRTACPGCTWTDFSAAAYRTQHGRRALAAFRRSRRITHFPKAKQAALASLLARHRKSRVLVFTSDNETAYAISRKHLVMPITCDIGRKERELALAAFRSGELATLVSAQVLNEGIDIPDADVAIIVGGVRGAREHVQRVGRLLRPAPGKQATVYELVMLDTHEIRKSNERRRGLAHGSKGPRCA